MRAEAKDVADAPAALAALEKLKFTFAPGAARQKLASLSRLERAELARPNELERLHDLLLFQRAYPDDRNVLARVEGMLRGFEKRPDLARHRTELVNSGIAGTDVEYRFYWYTLCWIAERWPHRLHVDWAATSSRQRELLTRRLPLLVPYVETLALDEATRSARQWIDELKGERETDAAFIVRRYRALRADAPTVEATFEEIDLPFRLAAGRATPCSTHGLSRRAPVFFQGTRPLKHSREGFREAILSPPRRVVSASRREARELIDLARALMVARSRDLDCFAYADERDVRRIEDGEGLEFACLGTVPERRQLLDAAYGLLMLRNGVPVGYVLCASLYESSEVAFNVSPAFRGAEAARLYARTLAVVRHLFGAEAFMVDPYQMGHDNTEGLESGAWWFYYKLGFRPRDPEIVHLARTEERRVAADPRHRTSLARLERLSSVNMYLELGPSRAEIMGELARENVGLHVVRYLARRFGAERERGIATCMREAGRLLGLSRLDELASGERLAFERWAPLVLLLPDIARWSRGERLALAEVVRAKGGRRESDFVRRFDAHASLRQALWQLAAEPPR